MQCENMAKIVCRASELKSDDRKFKQVTFAMKSCSLCNHAAYEDAKHMIMSCHGQSILRNQMYAVLENNVESRDVWRQFRPDQVLETLLGGNPLKLSFNTMLPIWCTSMKWVDKMYRHQLSQRAGIG